MPGDKSNPSHSIFVSYNGVITLLSILPTKTVNSQQAVIKLFIVGGTAEKANSNPTTEMQISAQVINIYGMTSHNTEILPMEAARYPATVIMPIRTAVKTNPTSILSVGRSFIPSRSSKCQSSVTGGSMIMMKIGLSP